MMQQNPAAQQIMAAIQSHMMDHLAFKYRKDIEKQLGVSLPPMEDEGTEEEGTTKMTPEMEVQVSQLSAMAAQQLLQSHIAQAQAEQAAQQAQDPVIQMQQQELQLKAQDSQRKMMESQAKMQLDQAKLALENKKVDVQSRQANIQTVVNAVKRSGGGQ
jgi:hypothetical protein